MSFRNIITITFILILLGSQLFLLVKLYDELGVGIELLSWVTGAILPLSFIIFNLLRQRSLRFFILVSRFRTLISDTTPTWILSASWSGETITADLISEIYTRLKSNGDKNYKVKGVKIHKDSWHINITPGPSLELNYYQHIESPIGESQEPSSAYIHLRIQNYRVGYRRTSYSIKHEISPILETINQIIGKSNAKYTLKIDFEKSKNPFLGLYLSHLPLEAVSRFVVKLDLSDIHSANQVTVSEDSIAINTQSQSALQNLALEFLTYDFGLVKRLANAH